MKTRITLTIDPAISHRAKAAARRKGTSVSGLVEQLLAQETATPGPQTPAPKSSTFSARWAGRLRLAQKNEPRRERLKKKYGL